MLRCANEALRSNGIVSTVSFYRVQLYATDTVCEVWGQEEGKVGSEGGRKRDISEGLRWGQEEGD